MLEWGGGGLQKNDDENFSYCPLSKELHLIQIIHGNFPPHQSDQGSTRKGGVGVLEWGGGGGGGDEKEFLQKFFVLK
jgi:hypothetical protein